MRQKTSLVALLEDAQACSCSACEAVCARRTAAVPGMVVVSPDLVRNIRGSVPRGLCAGSGMSTVLDRVVKCGRWKVSQGKRVRQEKCMYVVEGVQADADADTGTDSDR